LHTSFNPGTSLAGGVLIGVSASLLWATHGRIAGITGIVGESLRQRGRDLEWRLLFLAGLVGGGRLIGWFWPAASGARLLRPGLVGLLVAGFLVGFGTRLGNGCTSGHGVCGIGRLSPRSIVATGVFMATGMAAVWISRHLPGVGAP
jgi:uncharacterized protein